MSDEYDLVEQYVLMQLNKQRIYSELSDNTLEITCKSSNSYTCAKKLINKLKNDQTDLLIVDKKSDLYTIDSSNIDYIIKSVGVSKYTPNKVYDKVFNITDTFVNDKKLCYNTIINL